MSHVFAFYSHDFDINENLLSLKDKDLYRRITSVNRLRHEDKLIIFNDHKVFNLEVSKINKKDILFNILSKQDIKYLEPKINLYVGLVKKDDFEQVLNRATILGASTITPILSERIHKNWWDIKNEKRFKSIMISAAEQSKNFALPKISSPISLAELISSSQNNNFFYLDATGKNFLNSLQESKLSLESEISLLVGPEGGFSFSEEKKLNSFEKASLAPTILKTVEAVTVSLGLIRIFLKNSCI